MKKKIKIICTYYGTWPWYFPYFINSCAYNPAFEFLILSDIPVSIDLPLNVSIEHLTTRDFELLASERLGFPINISDPYKLCDFKPAYGHIFGDHLKGYDFWGHGDIDVIFGNISNFVTDDLLDDYDVIAFRHDFLTGYFTLFRNNALSTTLFKNCSAYQYVFQSPKHFCFDETNFTFKAFTKGLHYSQIHSEIESMTHIVKRLQENKTIRAYFDFHVVEGTPGSIKWVDGTLTYKDRYEAILYHLIRFKRLGYEKKIGFIDGSIRITPTKILRLKQQTTRQNNLYVEKI
jgi:hypothetical protein